jgi:hypothetical protein
MPIEQWPFPTRLDFHPSVPTFMKPTSNLMAGIVILAVGMGAGWFLRTQWEIPQGHKKTLSAPESAETTDSSGRPSAGKPGETSALKNAGAAPPATPQSPRETAMTLLREILKDGDYGGGPPPDFFNFLQALSGCDAPTLKDMLAEIRAMDEDPKHHGRNSNSGEFSLMILARLGDVDPSEAVSQLIEMKAKGGRLEREMLHIIFSSIAKTHPEQAPSLINRMPDEASKQAAQDAWTLVRSKQNPELALQEFLALPKTGGDENSNHRSQITRELIMAVAHQSPEKGLQAALATDEAQRPELINSILEEWGHQDPEKLAAWALKAKDPTGLRIALEKKVAAVHADQLRRDFATLGPDSRAKELLAASLGSNYAQQDLTAAVEWSNRLSGANQANAQNGIASIWIGQDPIAASEWLTTWPSGNPKDEAVGQLVNKIHADDPESALTWAATIEGPSRFRSMAQALQTLQIKDPIAAANVLKEMSEEDRRKIQQGLNGR